MPRIRFGSGGGVFLAGDSADGFCDAWPCSVWGRWFDEPSPALCGRGALGSSAAPRATSELEPNCCGKQREGCPRMPMPVKSATAMKPDLKRIHLLSLGINTRGVRL